jgi:hypothetical protein
MADDNQNRGDNAGQRRIRRLRGADVHPAECDQFQRAAEHNPGF